ncbi:MAG TPA: methyltransferase [Methanocellales archaeon]|nr:methyltransferase [Methanocellales archaeon]
MKLQYRDKEVIILPKVYEPAEDSFLMVEAVLREVQKSDSVLEIGTGSGIISMFVKDIAQVIATDISPQAVKCAKLNGIDVIRADLFDGINVNVKEKFDWIVFNPPYLPSEEQKTDMDALWDGGPNGRATINRFLDQVKDYLTEDGRILLLASSLAGIEQVIAKMESLGLAVDGIMSEKHFFERLVVLRGFVKRT